MKIDDNHLYYGSALIQIAEHEKFTAINSIKIDKKAIEGAYRINRNIGIYVKYAMRPHGRYKEYLFNFHLQHLDHLKRIYKRTKNIYIILVCVKRRQICAISYNKFLTLLNERKKDKGKSETQYTILVNLPKGKSFRVYINAAGVKKTYLKRYIINRNDFPSLIFN